MKSFYGTAVPLFWKLFRSNTEAQTQEAHSPSTPTQGNQEACC